MVLSGTFMCKIIQSWGYGTYLLEWNIWKILTKCLLNYVISRDLLVTNMQDNLHVTNFPVTINYNRSLLKGTRWKEIWRLLVIMINEMARKARSTSLIEQVCPAVISLMKYDQSWCNTLSQWKGGSREGRLLSVILECFKTHEANFVQRESAQRDE